MSADKPDRTCPLCGEDNNCQNDRNCWCHSVRIPEHIFKLIPADKIGKACVCRKCIEKHQRIQLNGHGEET